VLEGTVTPGTRVLLLDDINGWWPASGTALHLAQQRHQVTVVTAAEKAGAALDLSMTGDTLRERFAKFGVEVLLATALSEWKDTTARLINLYTGELEEREFDSLVLATTNTPEDRLTKELADAGLELHAIGDTVAARSASMAFYEGRKLALAL
jgi:NADPH-dependent 2,4-dienoyl-CoA reductase/sulfur reductase-like enzyme